MKHPLPALDALKVFESAARQLSFSEAARELCITKGAVSYQIRRLEETLDCALFQRSVRQVYLTNAGQQLLQTTQRSFAELTDTLRQIKPGDKPHDVMIGATTYVALRWLSPRISGFSHSNPDTSILLQHSVNSEDFRIQDVDFAIRWCRIDGHGKKHRSLELSMPLFPVCSPRLLESIGIARRDLATTDIATAPLDAIPLLCEEERLLDLWQAWYGKQPVPLTNPRRVIADANVRTQAAVDGQGWTMADTLMQRELDAGDLVAPFTHRLDGFGYAIQGSPARYVNRKALQLRNWLIDHA
ncbi:MAG: LysR family transcriptional regulator [Gammaproteobacteria bacterium]|nr:LysR family transcriptional regulator [Gammaproteobacteria bacterium]